MTVPNAGTLEFEGSEIFGIRVDEFGGGGSGAVVERTGVGGPSVPLPPSAATFWIVASVMFMVSTVSAYGILRWRDGIPRIRELKVKKW